jgi:hypothetical protein
MKMMLNGWQRLWVVFSVIAVFLAGFLLIVIWSTRDSGVIDDLRNPACKLWRDIPEGYFPENYPHRDDKCYSIQSFLWHEKTPLRSVTDYDRFMLLSKSKVMGITFGVWLATIAMVYAFGWSIGWIARGFRKQTVS